MKETRYIKLHLPQSWNQCTTEELEHIASAIIEEQARIGRCSQASDGHCMVLAVECACIACRSTTYHRKLHTAGIDVRSQLGINLVMALIHQHGKLDQFFRSTNLIHIVNLVNGRCI